MMISLVEYATIHGKDPRNVRRMAANGRFQTAQKIGRNFVIDADEPYPQHGGIKSGKYVNWRKPSNTDDPNGGTHET